MSGEDLIKAVVGVVLGAIIAAVAWLSKTVIGNREAIAVQTEAQKSVLSRIVQLEEGQLTLESVRGVIEGALAKRDKAYEDRRLAADKLAGYEVRALVSAEMEKWFRRLQIELGRDDRDPSARTRRDDEEV